MAGVLVSYIGLDTGCSQMLVRREHIPMAQAQRQHSKEEREKKLNEISGMTLNTEELEYEVPGDEGQSEED